jgi:hypothetical protein
MPNPSSSEPESSDNSGPGCAVLLLLFVICMAAPLVSLRLGGPWAGAGASVLAVLGWSYFGLRPAPGLVPGLTTVAVWLQGMGVLLVCGVRIVRSLLAA